MFKKLFLFSSIIVMLLVLSISPVLAGDLNLINSSDDTSNTDLGYSLNAKAATLNSGAHLSAEYLLSSLAQDKRNQRVLGSSILIVSGGALIGIGALAFNGPDYEFDDTTGSSFNPAKVVFYVCGGTLCGVGLINLAIPTLAEREYTKVKLIQDPAAREQVAYGSLVSLAEKAKYQRLISGLSSAGLCVYYLIASPDYSYSYDYDYNYSYSYTNYNYYMAASFGISALYSFLVKSPEESMLDRYSQANSTASYQAPDQKTEAFQIKIMPYQDGLSAKLVFNY